MQNILSKIRISISKSFDKGLFIGIADIVFRAFSLIVWLFVVWLLCSFVWEAIFDVKITSERIWWILYSLMCFVVITLLAYTAVYDRE